MTVWFKRDPEKNAAGSFWRYTIDGFNAGSFPIPSVAFIYYDGDVPKQYYLRDAAAGGGVIQPQGKAIGHVVAKVGDHHLARQCYLIIRDRSNHEWVRNLHTGKYARKREFARFRFGRLKKAKANR